MCTVSHSAASSCKSDLKWQSFQMPFERITYTQELHSSVAAVLTRLKARRTTGLFKEVLENATILAEAADIYILMLF